MILTVFIQGHSDASKDTFGLLFGLAGLMNLILIWPCLIYVHKGKSEIGDFILENQTTPPPPNQA